MKQRDIVRKCHFCKVVFVVALCISVGLIVGGFFMPPQGEIDGSVLTAVGELIAFPTLSFGFKAIELGYDLRMSHGDTTVEVSNGEA